MQKMRIYAILLTIAAGFTLSIASASAQTSTSTTPEHASGTVSVAPETPRLLINNEGLTKAEMRQMLYLKEEPTGEGEEETAVHIKAARVTEVEGDIIRITVFDYAYAVHASGSARFIRRTSEPSSIEEVSEGDVVNLQGILHPTEPAMIELSLLRNLSVQKRQVSLQGSVGHSTSSEDIFLHTEDERFTILTSTSTKIINHGTSTKELKEIEEGTKIMVRGILDSIVKKIKAELITVLPLSAKTQEEKSEEFKKRVDEKLNEIRKKATEAIEKITP